MEFVIVEKTEYGTEIITEASLNSNVGEIKVWENEGDYYPHFHIKSKDRQPDVCVEIFRSRYFPHGTKTSQLSKKDEEKLESFMSKQHKSGVTNWEYIRNEWFKSFPKDAKSYSNIKKPVYDGIAVKFDKTVPFKMKVNKYYDYKGYCFTFGTISRSKYSYVKDQKVIVVSRERDKRNDEPIYISSMFLYNNMKSNIVDEIWVSEKNCNVSDNIIKDVLIETGYYYEFIRKENIPGESKKK